MFCLDMSEMIMVPIDIMDEIEQKQTYSLLSYVSRILQCTIDTMLNTRKDSSKMGAARLPAVRASVATTKCQHQLGVLR